ncbi:hypothetical protein APSETT444_000827 [Aspergillus pseudonomiae]
MSNQQNNPQSPRHWHGSLGDRYEHHNVWVTGGPPQPYMARRPSGAEAASASATAERRGSSLFESLTNQKRNSTDPASAARRASYNDQAQQGGFFSKWWEGYTRGGSK